MVIEVRVKCKHTSRFSILEVCEEHFISFYQCDFAMVLKVIVLYEQDGMLLGLA